MDAVIRNRKFFLFEGFLFLVLGALAIALPQITTLSVELIIGWLFIIGGGIQLYRTWQLESAGHRWSTFFSALLSLILGVVLIAYPILGVLSLTMLLAAYFVVDGISKLYYGFGSRDIQGYGWLILSGILSLIIAGLIWSAWPSSAAWVIGLLVGINMFFFGISLIALVWSLPKE